jgi:hypothetical protein
MTAVLASREPRTAKKEVQLFSLRRTAAFLVKRYIVAIPIIRMVGGNLRRFVVHASVRKPPLGPFPRKLDPGREGSMHNMRNEAGKTCELTFLRFLRCRRIQNNARGCIRVAQRRWQRGRIGIALAYSSRGFWAFLQVFLILSLIGEVRSSLEDRSILPQYGCP